MIKTILKVLVGVAISLALSVVSVFLNLYFIEDVIVQIALLNVFMLVPLLILPSGLADAILIGLADGLVWGTVQATLNSVITQASVPFNIFLLIVSNLILVASAYSYIRSKNILFLLLTFLGLGASIAIGYFFWYYDYDFLLAFKSLFYIFQ